MNDDNIRQFPTSELPENTLVARRDDKMYSCSHAKLICDEHSRTIVCANDRCAKVIEPFQYIFTQALHIQDAWQRHGQVSRELRELCDRLGTLKKEEKRLRAMVKRLQDKTGGVIDMRPQS